MDYLCYTHCLCNDVSKRKCVNPPLCKEMGGGKEQGTDYRDVIQGLGYKYDGVCF